MVFQYVGISERFFIKVLVRISKIAVTMGHLGKGVTLHGKASINRGYKLVG